MVCVDSEKEIQRCFVAMWSFVATSDNLTGKFIIISGLCGLSNDPYQDQDLIGTTPKPKAEELAARAGEAGPQTEIFGSPIFSSDRTTQRITESQNCRIRGLQNA